MATKEVYCKATVVDNESHKVSQMEDETQDTIAKPKSETKDQRKPVVFGHTLRSIVVKI